MSYTKAILMNESLPELICPTPVKDIPTGVMLTYTVSVPIKHPSSEVEALLPYSTPVKDSSPEVRISNHLVSLDQPLVSNFPHNKKTQALGLSRIYFFSYLTKQTFCFPRIIPVSGDSHQVVILTQSSKVDEVTVAAIGRVVQKLMGSDLRSCGFVCSRIVRADEDECCPIKIAGLVSPPDQ